VELILKKQILVEILLPAALCTALGWWLGGKLLAIGSFEPFKVMNILGLLFDLSGLCILSTFVMSRSTVVEKIPNAVAGNFAILILGASVGARLRATFSISGVGQTRLAEFATDSIFFFACPIIVFLAVAVADSKRDFGWSDEQRTRIFGGFFLVYGIVLQVYAGILDLNN
jgi:hypothetical protein